MHQNSRKASAFIETGDKLSIKSPSIDYETSEFMSLKPIKLDLTGENLKNEESEQLVIQELTSF